MGPFHSVKGKCFKGATVCASFNFSSLLFITRVTEKAVTEVLGYWYLMSKFGGFVKYNRNMGTIRIIGSYPF